MVKHPKIVMIKEQGQTLNVLILEDRVADAERMAHELKKSGLLMEWVRVENEEDFCSQLAARPDVILADYELAHYDALRALRRIEDSGQDIPFIVVTGALSDEVAVDCIRHGAADYVLKDRLARLGPAVLSQIEQQRHREKRREAEFELRHREELLDSLVSHMLDGVLILDAHGRIQFANRSAARLFELESADDLLGMSIYEFVFPDFRENLKADVAKIRNGKGGFLAEYRFHGVKGSVRWAEALGDVITFQGLPADILSLRDVTRRRLAEEQIHLQSAALEAAANAIVITDSTGDALWVNRAFCTLTGYSTEEVMGQNLRLVRSGKQDAAFYRRMWKTILAGQVWQGELVNRRKEGTLYTEDMTITPVPSPGGSALYFIAIKQDVTARKRMEGDLLHAQKMETVGRLAGGVAHDFNNLLQVINGQSKLLLKDQNVVGLTREYAEEIREAGMRAASLTQQLLAFSRRQHLQPCVLDLNTVLADAQKILIRLIGEQTRLFIRMAPDLWSVRADRVQMEQVIMNLAVNARDAMPQGGTLSMETSNVVVGEDEKERFSGKAPGEYVMLAVRDTGMGMDEETMEHVFEPFFSAKKNDYSTGLGLSMVHGFVEQSGGHISVTSQPGGGASFLLYLPRVLESVNIAPCEKLLPDPVLGTETILLVEDEKGVRKYTAEVLQDAGYKVYTAQNGEEALQLAVEIGSDLKLLVADVIMPDLNGVEVYERMVKQNPGLRVVFITGYSSTALDRWVSIREPLIVLQKPFESDALLRSLREALLS